MDLAQVLAVIKIKYYIGSKIMNDDWRKNIKRGQ